MVRYRLIVLYYIYRKGKHCYRLPILCRGPTAYLVTAIFMVIVMAVTFTGTSAEEPEEQPKAVTASAPNKTVKYGKDNPHPDKGIYLKVPLSDIVLESTAYIGVASTGQLGITNVKFTFPIDLGNGEVMLTYHAGWGNLTIERDATYIKANNLLGKKSGVKVEELPDYTVDGKGQSNVEDLLGQRKSKD